MLFSFIIFTSLFSHHTELYLTERDCIARGLEYNLDIKIKSYEPKIAKWEIVQEESKFDPVASFRFAYDDFEKEKFLKTTSGDGIDVDVSVGLYKKFFSGTSVGVFYETGYDRYYDADKIVGFEGTDTFWSQQAFLKVTQPLLRNFGFQTNTANLRIAETKNLIKKYELQQQILQTITEIRFLYFNLIEAYETMKFHKQSLEFAQQFFEMTKESIDAGMFPPANLIEARRIIAERKQNLIEAEKKLLLMGNKLKKAVYPLDEDTYKDVLLIPIDKILFKEYDTNFAISLQRAFEHRRDLLNGKLSLQNENISVAFYHNQMLPKLDFSVAVGMQGLNEEWSQTYDSMSNADFPSWKFEVAFEIPVGNRSAQAKYNEAKEKRDQNKEKLAKIKNQIMFDIQEAIINVKAEEARVYAAAQNHQLAVEQLKNQRLRYEDGLITLFQLQDTEQKLTKARIEKIKAIIDHEKAIAALQYGEGDIYLIMRQFMLSIR